MGACVAAGCGRGSAGFTSLTVCLSVCCLQRERERNKKNWVKDEGKGTAVVLVLSHGNRILVKLVFIKFNCSVLPAYFVSDTLKVAVHTIRDEILNKLKIIQQNKLLNLMIYNLCFFFCETLFNKMYFNKHKNMTQFEFHWKLWKSKLSYNLNFKMVLNKCAKFCVSGLYGCTVAVYLLSTGIIWLWFCMVS